MALKASKDLLIESKKIAGLLALRTVAISGTFALATSLAARSDLAHAAAHQICLQLWLASSLLADSLAVAAQTLMAQGVAAKELQQTRKVIISCLHFNPCSIVHIVEGDLPAVGLARPLPGSGRLDAQGMATKELWQMRKVTVLPFVLAPSSWKQIPDQTTTVLRTAGRTCT